MHLAPSGKSFFIVDYHIKVECFICFHPQTDKHFRVRMLSLLVGRAAYVWRSYCRSEYAVQLRNPLICKQSRKRWILLVGALLLASFAGAVPVTLFPSSSTAVIAAFVGMTVCAFGKSFEPWKKSSAMVLVGALFAGGMLTAFQYRIHAFTGWVTCPYLCSRCVCIPSFHEEKVA